ncbi:bifunctional serine/threonine-protein kinase/ABC transporter substrate-binding protein [Streptomyces sp. N2-109]|uniref:Bifunctional serine/threonine-protein kinase/ABC transporter substrate-binding protein n=1 Tax=Streptomyces gossypii TaxID=2883101 RepID=A0ABT2K114_9ACTN|nr:bifunctional serine/threonine-protein kinase/ABC transporter substrate-binding protein [Streptomyces gossypii]MCT2593666.1 bifunctional serine/threonine-protein kinase/ABC transporter substrate-binding protein [Streptomyces gossypii]
MRALRAVDPEEVGGHRLLARLGAGGMGVVYLARSSGGAVVALKVIRAEHAADAQFRARFRREAEIARDLTGPWLVPVTSADAEAEEPWLATSYVPGPSLAEAVRAHGALPERSVRLLGARLASALADVHAAGLVHRDVKPGNVLLALDGPRLIDFGIARSAGPSALTLTDAVVGTPGYLAPEQTRATGDEVGPASDVFGLGCVLAYAASGRRPFGTGELAAVLFRTVHEPPDTAGLPEGLSGIVLGCLAKEPGERPSAADLRETLLPDSDARTDPDTDTGPGPQARDGAWLPPSVVRLVAARSSGALDPPPPEPRRPEPPVPEADGGATPSRRQLLAAGAAGAVALVGGITAYLATRPGDATAGGTGTGAGPRPVLTVGYHADLSGKGKAVGQAQERGIRLAVEAHNSRRKSRFTLALETFDDRGDTERAEETARKVIADPAIRAVIGPTSTAAAHAAGPLYEKARMAMVLVNVPDSDEVSSTRLTNLLVTRASDAALTTAFIDYLTRVREVTRTAVIDDREAGDLGWDWTTTLRELPPSEGTTTVHTLPAGDDDVRGAVRQALAARPKPQAVVYSGVSPLRAARCARALAQEGFTGARVSFQPVMTPAFLKEAGGAAEGWWFSAPYVDPRADDSRIAAFRKAHRARFKAEPGRWAAEAYDAVGLLARGLGAVDDLTDISRAPVTRQILAARHDGLAKTLRYVPGTTHSLGHTGTQFLYRVRDGTYEYLGPHEQVDDDT